MVVRRKDEGKSHLTPAAVSDHSETAFPDHHHNGFSRRYPERPVCPRFHAKLIATASEETYDEQETTGNLEGALRIDRRLCAFGRSATIKTASQVEAQLG